MKKRLISKLLLSSFVFAYTLISKPVNDFVFVRAELDWADPSSSQYENDWTYSDYKSYYTNYESLGTDSGSTLKTKLKNKISSHTTLSYANLWTAYKTTDINPSTNKIWDMYSSTSSFTYSTNQCGTYSGENSCYNREHSMPKSWFNDASPMYTDLMHIVPTDGYVNGRRSNYPFGEVDVNNATYASNNNTSLLGANTYSGSGGGTAFEPSDEYKGDFARIYFYMVTAYEDQVSTWTSSNTNLGGTSYPGLNSWSTEMLLKWSIEDPVSEKEINRNAAVYSLQRNRNPYVDNKGFACRVFGPYNETTKSLCASQSVALESISLDQETLDIDQYQSHQFSVTFSPSDVSDQSIKWSSSNETVGTISTSGYFNALTSGTTTIKAESKTNSSIYATCVVTVKEANVTKATSITVTQEEITIPLNRTVDLKDYVTIVPSDATTSLHFYSSTGITKYTELSEDGTCKGVMEGTDNIYFYDSISNLDQINLTITVSSNSSGDDATTGTYTLVSDVSNLASGDKIIISTSDGNAMSSQSSTIRSVASVTIDNNTIQKTSDDSIATFTLVDGSESGSFGLYDGEGLLSYSGSSNTISTTTSSTTDSSSSWAITISNDLASINNVASAGRLIQFNSGNPRFACYTSSMQLPSIYKLGASETETINVTDISLNQSEATIKVNETLTLIATITPSNATNQNVTWKSSDDTLATVTDGVVTALKSGEVIITATSEDQNKEATCTITINALVTSDEVIAKIKLAKDVLLNERETPSDLSSATTNITSAKSDYALLDDLEKANVTNYSDVSAIENALSFLNNKWYNVVRVQSGNDWSICDFINNTDNINSLVNEYNNLDTTTKTLLNSTYDVTASDGTIITIGTSMRYIANVASLNIDEGDTSNTNQLVKNNSLLRGITIASSILVLAISSLIIILILKRNKKEE